MKPLVFAALLIAGVLAGTLTHGGSAPYFGMLTLYVFLPALIFEAAWGLDAHIARSHWRPIVLLAVPGVVVTAGIVAALAHLAGLQWSTAILLGTVLSATDPIAVTAIFRALHVPAELTTIVEGESLMNDAVAVVLYRAVVSAAILIPALGVLGGIIVGILGGWIGSLALRRNVHVVAQIIATLAGAYGVYALCDRFALSGIFAVIAFGVTLHERERHLLSVTAAEGVSRFWSRLSFGANCALFFLLGDAVDLTHMQVTWRLAVFTIIGVVIARFVLAYGLLQLTSGPQNAQWRNVVRMAGIRGALSLALALATPPSFPARGALIDATFAVAIATTLTGALTFRRRLERMDLKA